MQIEENDVRLIRQRLLAIEEDRIGDARLIAGYLTTVRQLQLKDVPTADLNREFMGYWGVPASVKRVTILVDYGHEPVFRIPATLDRYPAPLGTMEVPFTVPDELVGSVKVADGPIAVEVAPSKTRLSFLKRFLGV